MSNVVFVQGNYEEEMRIRYHLKKPELLQLIKDNDSNYKNVKKLKKKELIEYILKQNYGGMFDNTVEENLAYLGLSGPSRFQGYFCGCTNSPCTKYIYVTK